MNLAVRPLASMFPAQSPETVGRFVAATDPGPTRVVANDDPRRVLEEVAPKVLRTCRGVLGPEAADVDDAVQETLVALLHALPAWRGEGSVSHYACRIAVRVSLRLREKARARGSVAAAAAAERELHVERGSGGDAQLVAVLRGLLDALPPEQAETLVLRFVLDHSPAEIAASMGVPVNTVRSRVRLGRELLLRRIGADPRLTELLGGVP